MDCKYKYPYKFNEELLPPEFVVYFRSGIPSVEEIERCCIYLENSDDIDDFICFAKANDIRTRGGSPWGMVISHINNDVCIYPDGSYASGIDYAIKHTENIITYQDLFKVVVDSGFLNDFLNEYKQGGIL